MNTTVVKPRGSDYLGFGARSRAGAELLIEPSEYKLLEAKVTEAKRMLTGFVKKLMSDV